MDTDNTIKDKSETLSSLNISDTHIQKSANGFEEVLSKRKYDTKDPSTREKSSLKKKKVHHLNNISNYSTIISSQWVLFKLYDGKTILNQIEYDP